MKQSATLTITLFIPVHYDDAACTEKDAFDTVQQMVERAVAAAIDGREVYTDGRYKDCTGPKLVRSAS